MSRRFFWGAQALGQARNPPPINNVLGLIVKGQAASALHIKWFDIAMKWDMWMKQSHHDATSSEGGFLEHEEQTFKDVEEEGEACLELEKRSKEIYRERRRSWVKKEREREVLQRHAAGDTRNMLVVSCGTIQHWRLYVCL